MGDPEPEPDPLLPFLVPPPSSPTSPRSALLHVQSSQQTPDPASARRDLPFDVSSAKDGPGGVQIELVKGRTGAEWATPSSAPASTPVAGKPAAGIPASGLITSPFRSTNPTPEPAHKERGSSSHPTPTTTLNQQGGQRNPETEDDNDNTGINTHTAFEDAARTEKSNGRSSQDAECQESAQGHAMAFPLPLSPTTIDPDVQEKGWALFPDLVSDLNRRCEQRAKGADGAADKAINSPEIQEAASMGDPFGTASRSPSKRSKFSDHQKGKQSQKDPSIHGIKRGTQDAEVAASSRQEHQLKTPSSSKTSEHAKTHQAHTESAAKNRAAQDFNPPRPNLKGFEFFRSKLGGRCYNCFSPNHIARFCRLPYKCWKCFRSGHRAHQCTAKEDHHRYKTDPTTSREGQFLNHTTTAQSTRDHRSYAEVVQGADSMAARFPGDPRARPARGYCAVTATGSIKRRRDDLVSKAVVCWLNSNSHDTETHHLQDAFLTKLDLNHGDFQIVKHFPEQFLVIFSRPEFKQRVLDRGGLSSRGRVFRFAPWNERLHATNTNWEFRVKVRIEGIPVHCWGEDVAAKALGRSCTVHYVEEKTRRRERTRTFDIWAWCGDPNDIPHEVWLTVTEPDKEQAPVSIPLPMTLPHRDDPTDLKRAQVFLLRNHLEIVEDLSFLQGRGRLGGHHSNRKASRELIWSYGVPDSVGERQPGRTHHDRGREQAFRRRDDDDYDRDNERRSLGSRRHRSVSSWVRNPRCRNAVQDCISSTRWQGGRSRSDMGSYQAAKMEWRPKISKEGKHKKKVSFADPIATELKPRKQSIDDDSSTLIQGETGMTVELPSEDHTINYNKMDMVDREQEVTGVKQALEITLKRMEEKLASQDPTIPMMPVEKAKMDAIQVLIEKGLEKSKKKIKKSRGSTVAPVMVGLEASTPA